MATREYNKIIFQTSFTKLEMFYYLLMAVKKKGVVTSEEGKSIIFPSARARISQEKGGEWSQEKRDTHSELTLRQYNLIRDTKDVLDAFEVSDLGERFLAAFELNEVPEQDKFTLELNDKLDLKEKNQLLFDILISVRVKQDRFGRDIRPCLLLFKLLSDEDLEGYITKYEWANIVNDSNNKLDEQYTDIKTTLLEFRIDNKTCEIVKSDRPLNGFVYWGVLDYYYPDSANKNIKYYCLNQEFQKTVELSMFMQTSTNALSDSGEEDEETREYVEVPMNVTQKIIFGSPGTGKSYSVEKELNETTPKSPSIRVIFHPDYAYSDFVGSLRPVRNADGLLNYTFVQGPLTTLLRKCFLNLGKPHYLIIEEVNRGNAAAIFGDLFQLLDRKDSGDSRYRIENEEISEALRRMPQLKNWFSEGQIWFPSNLNIICTMNTADQNVFVLDSAFKRRFEMEYTPIKFELLAGVKGNYYLNELPIFSGEYLLNVFKDTELEDFVKMLNNNGKLLRNWATFAVIVNHIIDMINKETGSEHISEDKKLGPFFVDGQDLNSKTRFINKVIYYLKQDVFKYVDTYFIQSFQYTYDVYSKDSADLFELLKRARN